MTAERSVVLYIANSLDGYIARENGEIDWLYEVNGEGDNGYADIYRTVDTVIMGKATYDQILTFGVDFPFSGKKCYVFTHSEKGANEHVEFVSGDVKRLIQTLKQQDGAKIWLVGGAELIEEFMKEQLIDEYMIAFIPVILGSGIPLFKKGVPETKLSLKRITRFGDIALLHLCK